MDSEKKIIEEISLDDLKQIDGGARQNVFMQADAVQRG